MLEVVNSGAPLVSNLAQEISHNLAGNTFPPESYCNEIVKRVEALDDSKKSM